ncbi:MAG: hypothetical protein Q4Q06_01145 [Bacteroidota bacterium]|nr:hypothetical protein [Bacteroidota bacterium]
MKKKRLMYIGIVLSIILIVILSNIMMREAYIRSVELQIIYPSKDKIIFEQEIKNDLTKHFGVFTQQRRKQIKIGEIRQYLENKNFVEAASVSISITGVLKIFITQRMAVVRVFDKNNKSYYLDKQGFVLKTESGKSVDVLIASGNISDTMPNKIDSIKTKQLFDIYNLSMMIYSDSILKYQIDQIARKDSSYILIPKIGSYEIVLGERKDWKQELLRLHLLYTRAFTKEGWDKYSCIDLRFSNQVICTRK